MTELVGLAVALCLCTVAVALVGRRFDASERRLIRIAYLAHIAAALLLVWVVRAVYGGGDLLDYHVSAQVMLDYLRQHPSDYIELWHLIRQAPTEMPSHMTESSTGTMVGIATVFNILFFRSLLGIGIVISTMSFLGTLAIYVSLKNAKLGIRPRVLFISAVLVPSVVFWSAGLLKESIAMPALGLLFWATENLKHSRQLVVSIIVGVVAAWVISIVKAYVLFPFAIAAGISYFWQRSIRSTGKVALAARPLYMIMGLLAAVGAVIALGELFPRFAISTIGEETASLQLTGDRIRGGSSYSLGPTSDTALGQFALAPLALLSAFFRPFPFEIRNPMMLAASAEVSVFAWLLFRAVGRRGLRRLWTQTAQSPTLVFCLTFSVLFALGVGLGSTNLGTLARYRMPMMPFYAALVSAYAYQVKSVPVAAVVPDDAAAAANVRGPTSRARKGPPLPGWRVRARMRGEPRVIPEKH